MADTPEDWVQLKADLTAKFTITIPDALNDALVDGVANLADAKPIMDRLVKVVSSLMLIDSLDQKETEQKSLISGRITLAKQGYEQAHPEEMPIAWEDYDNATMFLMIQPYDPYPGTDNRYAMQDPDIHDAWVYIYTTLKDDIYFAKVKIRNVLKKIIDVEPKS